MKTMRKEPRTVSYGATYIAEPDEVIATLPIGCADGNSYALCNRGFVLHRGKRVPVAGRVSMDMIIVSLGENGEGKLGEEVVIYSQQKGAEIPVDEMADMRLTMKWCLH
ncbi:alanine racemase [Bacillus tequilensis]|nr:alanine racemase [Bacillus tequilensis]